MVKGGTWNQPLRFATLLLVVLIANNPLDMK